MEDRLKLLLPGPSHSPVAEELQPWWSGGLEVPGGPGGYALRRSPLRRPTHGPHPGGPVRAIVGGAQWDGADLGRSWGSRVADLPDMPKVVIHHLKTYCGGQFPEGQGNPWPLRLLPCSGLLQQPIGRDGATWHFLPPARHHPGDIVFIDRFHFYLPGVFGAK